MTYYKTDGPADIAIVATGCIFPGRGDTTGFWRDIVGGVDAFSEVPETHWLPEDYYDADASAPDKTYGRRGGFLSPQAFDPVAFGVPPNALSSTDTSQLLALIAAQKVMDEARHESGGKLDPSRTSVILGVASATELTAHMAGRLHRPAWIKGMREAGLDEATVQDIADRISANFGEWRESTFPGLLGNVIAGRIANRLDLGGSNYVTDAACASSLSAMQIALHELRSGDSDTVLTGGVDTLNDILMFMCFSKTPALSPTGDCRPFSSDADGTMLGEGIGMLALRRLADAERDGNQIHAVIKGLGGASDGRATAIYAPLPTGQALALGRAYEQAGYSPDSVSLIEAHGTGTVAGDKAELEGLHSVFGKMEEGGSPWCAIGSVKSQIGHTKAAAGSASLIKVAGALSRKVLPPTLKVKTPAAPLTENSPFYINKEVRPWISDGVTPRRASVSSFGFGGSNFHVTLEEYIGPNAVKPPRIMAAELFLLSASSRSALSEAVRSLGEALQHEDDLSRLATESHREFDPTASVCAGITVADLEGFKAKAGRLLSYIDSGCPKNTPLGEGLSYREGAGIGGKVAFLFAGQGSQYVGMGAGLAMDFPAARRIWDEAASRDERKGEGLHDLAFPPAPFTDEEAQGQTRRLTRMEHAQPAIAAVSLAQLALLEAIGLSPDMCAGHSFGEVMALHAAGTLTAEAALDIARTRGVVMAEAAASSEGAMLAVNAGAVEVAALLERAGVDVVVANDNAPNQVVLSGTVSGIEAAERCCKSADLKVHRLSVATGFHSDCVSQAVGPFGEYLSTQKCAAPSVPVYANMSAAPYPKTPASIRRRLSGQIGAPVLFRQSLEAMYEAGARIFIEIGPGSVVSTIAKNALPYDDVAIMSLDHKRETDTARLLGVLGELSVSGIRMDLENLYRDLPAFPEAPPVPKFAVEISGANYDKPYPPVGGAAALPAPNVSDNQPSKTTIRTAIMSNDPKSPSIGHVQQPVTGSESVFHDVSQRHSEYMQMMTAAHTAFLAFAGSGQPPVQPAATIPHEGPPAVPPLAPPTMRSEPQAVRATSAAVANPDPIEAAPAPAPMQMPAPAPVVGDTVQPVQQVAQAAPAGQDPIAVVTALVAEKTGYPTDMLEVDMDLEGELGVDSIKQVEILSALREQVPGLPELEPEKLTELRTIRLVAGFVGQGMTGAPVAPVAAVAEVEAAPALAQQGASGGVTADTIRTLIAEKTGYPPEMLEDDMDLEGELGIDSIKQVEILSTLREQVPGLPDLESEQLAEMRTIRKIADFFQ